MIVVGGVEVCKWGGGVWEECGGRDGEGEEKYQGK